MRFSLEIFGLYFEQEQNDFYRITAGAIDGSFHASTIVVNKRKLKPDKLSRTQSQALRICLIKHSFRFIESIQSHVSSGQILVREPVVGIETRGFARSRQSFVVLAETFVAQRQIVDGNIVPWIGINPLLIDFNRLICVTQQLIVIVRSNVKPLALAGAVFEIESFPQILIAERALCEVGINDPQGRIGHGEVGIEFDGTF